MKEMIERMSCIHVGTLSTAYVLRLTYQLMLIERPFTTKMVLINHTASHGNKIYSRFRSHYYFVSVLQLIEVNYISEVWWSHPKQTLWKYAKTLHDATYGLDETWAWTILSNRWLLMISLSVILQGCLDSAIPESLLNHSPRCFRCPKWLVHATAGVSK